MDEPNKSNWPSEWPSQEITIGKSVDGLKLTREGGFPIGTRVWVFLADERSK